MEDHERAVAAYDDEVIIEEKQHGDYYGDDDCDVASAMCRRGRRGYLGRFGRDRGAHPSTLRLWHVPMLVRSLGGGGVSFEHLIRTSGAICGLLRSVGATPMRRGS